MNKRSISRRCHQAALLATALGWCASLHAATTVDLVHATVSGDRLFDPARAAYLPSQQDGLQVSVHRNGQRLELLATDSNGVRQSFLLPDEVAQLTQVRVNPQQVVAIGWINGSLASAVTVFDRASGSAIDRFWGYAPSLSPDGRLIAFVKFYPSHGIDVWEDQYRVYDLSRAPEANRPAPRTMVPGRGDMPDPLVDVGATVYPTRAAEQDRDASDIPDGRAHERVTALHWSADSSLLGFVDAQGGRSSLVVARVPPSGTDAIQTHVLELPGLGKRCGQGVRQASCVTIPTGAVQLSLDAADVNITTALVAGSNKRTKVRLADMPPAPR